MVFEPFGFARDSDPAEPCGGACLPESGHYGLVNAAGEYVPPDSAAHVIAVDKGDVYDVYNLGSGIDTDCEDVARWYAELVD